MYICICGIFFVLLRSQRLIELLVRPYVHGIRTVRDNKLKNQI